MEKKRRKKVKKNRLLLLDIKAWNDKLSVYFCDKEYILKDLKKSCNQEEYDSQKEFLNKEKLGGFSSVKTKDGGSAAYIWIPDFDSSIDKRGTLVHECVHAAMFYLTGKGVPVREENDEVLAYLVEYLFKESLSFAVKKVLK